jgi:hypothetical protein
MIKLLTKKAAMFGLDARIALAIFGALSVISGAALYSAIQQAKVTGIIANLQELEKSFLAYYLDTGSFPIYDADTSGRVHSIVLLEDTSAGWKGPYTSLKIEDPYRIIFGQYGSAYVRLGNINSSNNSERVSCINLDDKSCVLWIEWYDVPKNISQIVDEKIDGVKDLLNGKVRYSDTYKSMFFRFDLN